MSNPSVTEYFTQFVSLNTQISGTIKNLTDGQLEVANKVYNFCQKYANGDFVPSEYKMKNGETGKKDYETIDHFTFNDSTKTSTGEFLLSVYKTYLFIDHKPFYWFSEFLRWMCQQFDISLVFYFLVLNEVKETFTDTNGKQRQRVVSGMYSSNINFSNKVDTNHKWAVEFRPNRTTKSFPKANNSLKMLEKKVKDLTKQLKQFEK
jgi:acylphosphatase